MRRLARPDEPPHFEAHVADARAGVRDEVEAGHAPSFPSRWSDFKGAFAAVQHGKCAYCEVYVLPSGDGDVEHFAPKGRLSELLERGDEDTDLARLSSRRTQPLSERGYWWLAYEWRNYLFACAVCNQKWKRDLFPVQESPRALPPDPEVAETPLLLNPFDEDPAEHLRFDREGYIEGLTSRGRATIQVCGLDRLHLSESRRFIAKRVYDTIQRLNNPEFSAMEDSLFQDLQDMLEDNRPHSGMAQSIVDRVLLG